MKDYTNIKNVNEAIQGKPFKELAVEERLFNFTVNFYHAMSLMKSTSERKTTKEYITFLYTKNLVEIVLALNDSSVDNFAKEIDGFIEKFNNLIDFTNPTARDNFIDMFNCESDAGGTIPKIAGFYCVSSAIFDITKEDIMKCMETI